MASMEYIFFAVIFYFIMQAASNLVMIMRGKQAVVEEDRSHGWRGPSPRQYTGSERSSVRYWDDMEEARWKDVQE
ncbi:hypothetical protein [Longibacter sp.]|jgi:hypothetical protein|uniref:hypothetical protein n=1 Tax=Longibacter sp. TaxID=2045415 RepID=UPI003EBAA1BD